MNLQLPSDIFIKKNSVFLKPKYDYGVSKVPRAVDCRIVHTFRNIIVRYEKKFLTWGL
jgi:hypothetical protein